MEEEEEEEEVKYGAAVPPFDIRLHLPLVIPRKSECVTTQRDLRVRVSRGWHHATFVRLTDCIHRIEMQLWRPFRRGDESQQDFPRCPILPKNNERTSFEYLFTFTN